MSEASVALAPLSTLDPHASASDSEADSVSLCGSELELEMAWGQGPIAPLRNDAAAEASDAAAPVRSLSNGNGSGRARTPQKLRSESPLTKSKRLINIHPIRSATYLAKPNELPVGVRKQQRWFNGKSDRLCLCMGPTLDGLHVVLCHARPPLWQSRCFHATGRLDGTHANQR